MTPAIAADALVGEPSSLPAAGATLARAADAEELTFSDGSSMRLLADSSAIDGLHSVHVSTLRDGAGASPHHHEVGSEVFYVVRGAIELLIGEEIVLAARGDLAVVPPGVTHAFAAVPGDEAEVLVAVTPGIERFDLFRAFTAPIAAFAPPRPPVLDGSAFDTYPDDSAVWQRARAATPSPSTSSTHQERP